MKYIKKPVVIEAVQWDGENTTDVLDFATGAIADAEGIYIDTLEGRHRVSMGDYIIKGIKSEFCPCKPDIFAATYEPLAQPEPLSLEQLHGMNDQMVYVQIPNDFGADLIIPSLVACNADNADEPDEVYLTNNLGGRSTYDEVIDEGGAVYARKPRER